jgi:hypothetical protein
LRIGDWRLPIAACLLPFADWRLNCRLRIELRIELPIELPIELRIERQTELRIDFQLVANSRQCIWVSPISNQSTISNHQWTSRNPQSALANPQFFSVCWK